MFSVVVNHLVESIGDDFYLPSPSTASTKNLTPLSLVERKTGRFKCSSNKYHAADFMLRDIVLNESFGVSKGIICIGWVTQLEHELSNYKQFQTLFDWLYQNIKASNKHCVLFAGFR